MYSTEISELAHKDQIKDWYRRSNRNEAARQIFSQYRHQHPQGMRLWTREPLLKTAVIIVGNSGMEMPTSASHSTPQRMLKGRPNIGTLSNLCRAHEIEYCDMMQEMLPFVKQTAADDPRLPNDPTKLWFLPVERFTQLELSVSDFQEADFFQIHQTHCTGRKAFRKCGAANDQVWVQTGGEGNYGDLPR